jgi:hypothetical protein
LATIRRGKASGIDELSTDPDIVVVAVSKPALRTAAIESPLNESRPPKG